MQKVTIGYKPADALGYFEAISNIPRGSYNEKAVAEYIYNFGKSLGLDSYIDDTYNVVIKKPASKGCENAPAVLLQGHTDIVCVKLPDSNHNFETDPLPLYIEDGKLKSKGTTLGADNGNAVAYMMALLSRDDYIHPALECVFTSMEEVGLNGAIALDKNTFSAKRMINMDAGGLDTSVTTVSCAGGIELKMTTKPVWVAPLTENFISISITGLKGGHSAGAINQGRGNAAKLMARIINSVMQKTQVNVAGFMGGDKMNAIISDCTATICVTDKVIALATIETVINEITAELRVTDNGFKCEVSTDVTAKKVIDKKQSKRFIQFVLTIPSTVRDMDFELVGHTLCSTNLGAVQLKDKEILLWTLTRSGEDTRMQSLADEIIALADVFDYTVNTGAFFYGWKYNPNSELRNIHAKLYEKTFGKTITQEATHGGLECGVFYGKEPEMDIITLAPQSSGAHTPEEYLVLESFNTMFEYLLKLLEELSN